MERFHATIQPILDILDEGLRLYRRGFLAFLLLTALWLVPLAIGTGLTIATSIVWWFFFTLLLAFPLAIYLVGGLSRLTLAVQHGHAINLRATLAIPLQRLIGMGCYSVVFLVAVNIATSIVTSFIFCCGFFGAGALLGGAMASLDGTGALGSAMSLALGSLLVVLIILSYVISLIVSGATYSSTVYSLQPFAQHEISFGEAIQRSIDLLFYRPVFNLAAFTISSTVFGATALAVTATIGVFLPLPLILLFGEESTIVRGVSAFAWIIGLIVVVPPMPIWMALLYQQNYDAWSGKDLLARITPLMTKQESELQHDP